LGRYTAQFGVRSRVDPAIWDVKSGRAKGKSREAARIDELLDRICLDIHV
jgi:hypothetical protein